VPVRWDGDGKEAWQHRDIGAKLLRRAEESAAEKWL